VIVWPAFQKGFISLADDDTDDDDFKLEGGEHSKSVSKKGRKAGKKGKAKKSAGDGTQVLSYRHLDKRVNNPEVGMVHPENDPEQPKTKWAYDPHIDPALQFDSSRSRVERLIDDALASDDKERIHDTLKELKKLQEPYLNWAGKAERTSFEIDTVSLHVHERIDPASILSAIRKRMKGAKDGREKAFQPGLFDAPFENLPLRQALDFYKHEKNWSNRLIAGDSLLVMNSLLNKESMAGQVQMIYIDPPYGIKYGSNFQPFTNKRDVKDGADDDLTQEPEMIKAFRDTWELSVHSYLTYLRDRLLLAKDLLHESGSVFVQISDENLHHLREIMDEVLGVTNFLGVISFRKTTGQAGNFLPDTNDYIVWYGRDKRVTKFNVIYQERAGFDWVNYDFVRDENGEHRKLTTTERLEPEELKSTKQIYRRSPLTSASSSESTLVEFEAFKSVFTPGKGGWKTNFEGLSKLLRAGRLESYGTTLSFRRFTSDFPFFPYSNAWTDTASGGYGADKVYVVQTSAKVIERCILMTTDPGDLVLDPTCGSGTTAFVAEKLGRRWITCDTSRVAITLAKQRLTTASFDYYSLRYPHEGLKGGFIYQTVPHITLKAIANNPDIDSIYMAMQPAISASLNALNTELKLAPAFYPAQGYRKGKPVNFTKGERLEEWEVPFDCPPDEDDKPVWPSSAREYFEAFHKARQAMQAAMDAAIKAHAEPETLYDKPEVDKTRLRIAGPFSVEAVPNPTVMALDETNPTSEASVAIVRSGETSRQTMWRDELMRTGIRGKGGQMLYLTEL
jgi:adenine-specific DNA-methyltransferase